MKREFLMLAQNYNPRKHSIGGCFVSTKLDGMRCFWDGGVSTGIECSQIPWANTDKHDRFDQIPVATGLWTRYGQPIRAPRSWTDKLPNIPLDGELIAGNWNQTISICKSHNSPFWHQVTYWVFDSPPLSVVFSDGMINNTQMKKRFLGIAKWLVDQKVELSKPVPFYAAQSLLSKLIGDNQSLKLLEQVKLPASIPEAKKILEDIKDKVIGSGGEGVMLRVPWSYWLPERSHSLLKVKAVNDAEGTVVGYKWGKPSDTERTVSGEATNKLLGLMGSITLKLDSGVIFDLSGFTDAERVMRSTGTLLGKADTDILRESEALREGYSHPGEVVAEGFTNPKFPRGSKITFKYRELSPDGVPKEARFFRKRED